MWHSGEMVENVGESERSVETGGSLAKMGGQVALASTVSRITGFVRTLALAAVLGIALVSDAYNAANSFPNMVYQLLLGGILASVLLPYLTRQRSRGRTLEREQTQRVLTVGALALALVTVVAVVCAPPLVSAVIDDPAQRELTTLFAYLLLPEIFFYGVTAMMTAVLSVRSVFGAPAWAPVINNVVLLVTVAVFLCIPGPVALTPESMTTAQVLVIGVGTLLGIVAQTAVVARALHRNGFRWRLRVRVVPHTWRPVRVGAPLLGWVLVYVVAGQIGVWVTMKVTLSRHVYSMYTHADLLFQVAYGILGVSLLTVLMPRIARSVAAGDDVGVVSDLGRGARYSVVALIPVTVALMVFGPSLTTLIFFGRVDGSSARLIGTAVAVSAFGLVPFAMVMLQLRVFYADNNTRTPAVIALVMVVAKTVLVLLASLSASDERLVLAVCAAGSFSYVCGAVLGHILLRKRYGLLGFRRVQATVGRISAAAILAGGCALALVVAVQNRVPEPRLAAVISLSAGAAVGAVVLLGACKVVGVPEIRRARTLLLS